MNKSKLPHVFAARKPKVTQPIHEISRPGPIVSASPTHEDIARRAYQIYVEKGRPQGQSEQIWQQAEQDIRNRGLATFLSR